MSESKWLLTETQIDNIKEYFLDSGRLRDLLFFNFSIETNLKNKEIRFITVGDVLENKRGILRHISNDTKKNLKKYIIDNDLVETSYLFKSRKGDGPISHAHCTRIIKEAIGSIGLESDNYSTMSLKKSRYISK